MSTATDSCRLRSLVLPVESGDPASLTGASEFQYIDIASVDRISKSITNASLIQCEDAPSRARQLVMAGDILVSTVRPNLNAVAMVPDHLDGSIASTGFCVLRLNPKVASRNYVFHWVRHSEFVNHMVKLATGASYPAVSDRIVLDSTIPAPEPREQQRIAAILDRADAIRRKRRDVALEFDKLHEAAFLKSFGDPATNPKRWPLKSIGELLDHSRGGTRCGPFGSLLSKSEYVPEGIPVWGIDNVAPNQFLEPATYFITEDKYSELTSYSVEAGDILISRAGTVGRMCVARPTSSSSIIGTNLIRVAVNHDLLVPEYLTALFTFFPKRVGGALRSSSDEDAYSFMKTSVLTEIPVPYPAWGVQRDYVEFLGKLSQVASTTREHQSAANVLFKSLVQRAFRGDL